MDLLHTEPVDVLLLSERAFQGKTFMEIVQNEGYKPAHQIYTQKN